MYPKRLTKKMIMHINIFIQIFLSSTIFISKMYSVYMIFPIMHILLYTLSKTESSSRYYVYLLTLCLGSKPLYTLAIYTNY